MDRCRSCLTQHFWCQFHFKSTTLICHWAIHPKKFYTLSDRKYFYTQWLNTHSAFTSHFYKPRSFHKYFVSVDTFLRCPITFKYHILYQGDSVGRPRDLDERKKWLIIHIKSKLRTRFNICFAVTILTSHKQSLVRSLKWTFHYGKVQLNHSLMSNYKILDKQYQSLSVQTFWFCQWSNW